MANPQLEKGFLQIANDIWDEVIRRDFTKRQKDILLFIWRLSYGCRKKMAIIPKLKHFEVCGVSPQNVTKELNYLVSCKVLNWDKESAIFQVNKDYEQWQISPVKGWDEEVFKDLIRKNLSLKTSQNEKSSNKKTSQNKKFSTGKILYTSQNKKSLLLKIRSSDFLKQEVQRLSIPCGCRAKRSPKYSIKYSITTTTTTTTPEPNSKQDFSFGNVFKAYEKNFIAGGKITEFDIEEFSALFDDYGGEWLLQAMREAYRQGPDKRNLAYVNGVLKGYRERGGPSKQNKDSPRPGRTVKSDTRQQQLDELDKLIEEEEIKRGTH